MIKKNDVPELIDLISEYLMENYIYVERYDCIEVIEASKKTSSLGD